MSFDFGALERLWLTSIEEALTSIEFGRGGRLYAIAFWLFYREYGSVIHPPMVGLGEETAWQKEWGSEGRDAGFASGRWSPADWKYDILTLPRADAIEAYTTLATEACGMDPEEARDAHDDPKRRALGILFREEYRVGDLREPRANTARTGADRCVRRVATHGRLCHRRMRSKSRERWRAMASSLR
jgi:hypothetical protein